jgi:RHS repeat-associated protein
MAVKTTPRGFTGHEHLDDVGLIHMNGRVYDPVIGRFLSADPIIQFPRSTQGLNRYTYVNNNPLSFTDPSGFGFFSSIGHFFKSVGKAIAGAAKAVVHFAKMALQNPYVRIGVAIAAAYFTAGAVSSLIIQGAINSTYAATGSLVVAGIAGHAASMAVSTAIISGAAGGFVGGLIVSAGDLKAAGIGALTGGAFGFVGGHYAFGSSLSVQRIAAHGLIGGTASVLRGGKFLTGLATGAFAKIATPIGNFVSQGNAILGAVSQAVVGGTVSVIGGGKFANGAITAAYGYLFNELVASGKRERDIIEKLRSQSSQAAEIIDELETSERTWTVTFDDSFRMSGGTNPFTGEIRINPLLVDHIEFQATDGQWYTRSLDVTLGHELGHAYIAEEMGALRSTFQYSESNYDLAIQYENRIARELDPQAPMRPQFRGHRCCFRTR